MHDHIQHYEQEPNKSADRNFGLIFAAFFLIIALLPLLHGGASRLWAVGISFAFGIISLVTPSALTLPNRLWMMVGQQMHRIISPVILAILFYGLITPTGLLMRLFGKDSLHLSFDNQSASYWIERNTADPVSQSFKNQF
jgi:hypothetical protein